MNKSDVNVYLDKYGYAIYVSGVEGETNYAAVIGIGLTNQYGSETRGVTLLLPDGTQKTVTAKLADNGDWQRMSAKGTNDYTPTTIGTFGGTGGALSAADANKNLVKDGVADLVTYTVGDDGVYTLKVVESQGYSGRNEATAADGTTIVTYATGNYVNGSDAYTSHASAAPNAANTGAVFTSGKSEIEFNTKFADVQTGTTASYQNAATTKGVYYTTSKTVFMVATNKTAGSDTDGIQYSVYTGYENAPTFFKTTGNFLATNVYSIVFAMNSYYTKQIDAVYIYADKMAGVSGTDTYFVKAADANVITDSDGTAYYELPAVVKNEITTIKIQANLKKNWDGGGTDIKLDGSDNTTGTKQGAISGAFGIKNVVRNSKGIITNCDLDTFNKVNGGSKTVAADGIVLGLNGDERTADFVAYNDATKVYRISNNYKTITAIQVEDVQTDANDDVWANWDSDSKKLTDVLIHEVNDGTVTPPSVTTSPNNVEKLTIGSNEVQSIEAVRSDGSQPFVGISQYLQDGLKYEYNSDLKRLTVSGKITMAFSKDDAGTNIPGFGTPKAVVDGSAYSADGKWVSFIPIPVGDDWIILYYVDSKVGTTNIVANHPGSGPVQGRNEAFTIVWDLDWSKYPNP